MRNKICQEILILSFPDSVGIDKNILRDALNQIGVAETVRGEQLTMEQLAALSDILYK